MRKLKFKPERRDDPELAWDTVSETTWHRCFHRALYADTDRAGVVYHANYLRYFELGRVSLIRSTGHTHRQIEESGFIHPIIDLGITFCRGLGYDDGMYIYTRPTALERVKITFSYRIMNEGDDTLLCHGYTTHACVNRQMIPVAVDPMTIEFCRRFGLLPRSSR